MKESEQTLSDYYESYGKYPIGLEPDKINNMSEVDLYFLINDLYKIIEKASTSKLIANKIFMSNYHANYVIPNTKKFVSLFNYFAVQTKKFGVESPEDFRGWINFYNNFYNNLFINSPSDWQNFQKLRARNEDTSAYLPKTNWENSLKASERKQKIHTPKNAYPDFLNPEKVKDLSETDLFFNINDLNILISKCDRTCDVKTKETLKNILDFYLYQTRAFGVEVIAPNINKHYDFANRKDNQSLYKWYLFFLRHFDINLSSKDKKEFFKVRQIDGDLTPYLPKANCLRQTEQAEKAF